HDQYRSSIGAFYGPILIFDPSGEITPGERDAIAQQIDIMPTLLSYLGYDRPYLAFGCDLLSTPADDTWAVNYTNNIYQYVKNGYILQFDGEKTIGVYDIEDHLLERNLIGKTEEQPKMETELKAIIQSYMDRMLEDRLVVKD
ncbi:MAG: LTA synthase family protein, partial [Muribaculaceae bacterium]|nr:LTA synthase family protein [Muribaculaceae bacterium]